MRAPERRSLFNKRPQNNFYRIFLYLIVIIAGLGVYIGVGKGNIKSVGYQTPTPTRTSNSYISEGDAHFGTGDLEAAIASYQKALLIDPENSDVWANLARLQAYNSSLKTTDESRITTLKDALASINKAKELAPDNSNVAAIRAFVLDWNSSSTVDKEEADNLLIEADQEAIRALNLDPTNTLALAYYSEILIDQQRLTQAEQNIKLAAEGGQDIMDVHRIYAYLLESQQQYTAAIEEYKKAIAIAPNMTFLYVRIGANYRALAFNSIDPEQAKLYYFDSLDYFDKAASINEQLGVKDPLPYLSIAKTYSQLGDFYIAGRNVQKALSFDPTNPDVYGQLGIVFMRSRNFEGAIPALKCAIKGCTAQESCEARGGCDVGEVGVAIEGLELTSGSIVYYYSYVSNLAALSRPRNNLCPEAFEVIKKIRDEGFGSDQIVSQILKENENICAIVNAGGVIPTATGMAVVTQTPQFTPTITFTPEP